MVKRAENGIQGQSGVAQGGGIGTRENTGGKHEKAVLLVRIILKKYSRGKMGLPRGGYGLRSGVGR